MRRTAKGTRGKDFGVVGSKKAREGCAQANKKEHSFGSTFFRISGGSLIIIMEVLIEIL